MVSETQHEQREALKAVAVALKRAEVPFALAGSYAVWARGGPEGDHDVDFVVPGDDLAQAVAVLEGAGIVSIANTEDWLVKVVWGDVRIDLIKSLPHAVVDSALLGRADTLRVESIEMPVLAVTDVLVSKVLAFDEHHCDLAPCLAMARALREQLDYESMEKLLAESPFGAAFLGLTISLGIVGRSAGDHHAPDATTTRSTEESAVAQR